MRPAHRPAVHEPLQRLPASRAGGIPHTRETDACKLGAQSPPRARVASAPFPQAAPGPPLMRMRRTRANSAHSPRRTEGSAAHHPAARVASAPVPAHRAPRRQRSAQRRRERRIAQQRAVIAIFIVRPRPLRQRVGQQAVKPVPNTNIDISVISAIVFRARAAFGASRIPPQIPPPLRFMAFSSVSCAVHFYFTISFQCCQQGPPARKPAKPHPHSSASPKSAIALPPTSFHAKATRPPKSAIPSPPKPAS